MSHTCVRVRIRALFVQISVVPNVQLHPSLLTLIVGAEIMRNVGFRYQLTLSLHANKFQLNTITDKL